MRKNKGVDCLGESLVVEGGGMGMAGGGSVEKKGEGGVRTGDMTVDVNRTGTCNGGIGGGMGLGWGEEEEEEEVGGGKGEDGHSERV